MRIAAMVTAALLAAGGLMTWAASADTGNCHRYGAQHHVQVRFEVQDAQCYAKVNGLWIAVDW